LQPFRRNNLGGCSKITTRNPSFKVQRNILCHGVTAELNEHGPVRKIEDPTVMEETMPLWEFIECVAEKG